MINGIVNDQLEASLRVAIAGPGGREMKVTAVIDTGYNGMITLPASFVSTLALPPAASREVSLGDTSRKVFAFFTAEVIWGTRSRKVRVLCIEGVPLIGTTFLEGHNLDIDFVVGGQVVLTPIP